MDRITSHRRDRRSAAAATIRRESSGSTAKVGVEYIRPGSWFVFVAWTGLVSPIGPPAASAEVWARSTPAPTTVAIRIPNDLLFMSNPLRVESISVCAGTDCWSLGRPSRLRAELDLDPAGEG